MEAQKSGIFNMVFDFKTKTRVYYTTKLFSDKYDSNNIGGEVYMKTLKCYNYFTKIIIKKFISFRRVSKAHILLLWNPKALGNTV